MSRKAPVMATSLDSQSPTEYAARNSLVIVGAEQLCEARPSPSLLQHAIAETANELLIVLAAPNINKLAEQPARSAYCREVEQAIARAYVMVLTIMQRAHRPWLTVTVTLHPWCGYAPGELDHWDTAWCEEQDTRAAVLIDSWHDGRKQLGYSSLNVVYPSINSSHMATLSISPPSILPSLSSPVPSSNSNDTQWPIYQHAVIGGTFDHLHAGHKILLTMAAWITNDRLFCGVTDGSMLSNKQYRELLEPLETRILHIEQFFNTLCQSHRRYTVAPITDPFGPTITDPSMDVIVVSRETYKGGVAAQEARIERQLPTMAIHVIDVVAAGRRSLGEAEWSELKLSSTQIRARLYQELSISEA